VDQARGSIGASVPSTDQKDVLSDTIVCPSGAAGPMWVDDIENQRFIRC